MSIAPSMDISKQLQDLHTDAALWKARHLWKDATDPDKQASAIEQLTAMLVCIKNDTKRSGYITLISKDITQKAKAEAEAINKQRRESERLEQLFEKLKVKSKPTEEDQSFLDNADDQIEAARLLLSQLLTRQSTELREPLLKQSVKDALLKKRAEMEAIKSKAQFDKEIRTAADAGMPDDFMGSREDIFNALQYGIYEHKGGYWSRGAKGDYEVSNFTMKILYHVLTSDEVAYRVVAIKNRIGFECTIQMNTDDFVGIGSFKKVIARRGDYVFKGSETDLSRLQELLQKQEVSVKFIDVMGWQKRSKFWAWGNGITPMDETIAFLPADMHGMVDYNNKKYLIPACSSMYADKEGLYNMEKKFVYSEPQPGFGFEQWAKLMRQVYNVRAIPGILHYVATVYRDVVFKTIHKFPILNLFGPPGSGKSELAKSLSAMFGLDQGAISLEGESTAKSYLRKMAQAENAYVLLEEFKNNQVKHIGTLKNIYDGLGYDRAKMTNDNQTHQTPVRSAAILIGQEMPTSEPALFTRVILISFDGKDRNKEAFTRLTQLQDMGMGYITAGLISYRQLVEQNFSARHPIVMQEVAKDVADGTVMDRMILNISVLLTVMDILKDRLAFGFDWKEAKRVLIDNMMHQHHILAGSDNLSRWWGIVELLFHQGLIQEERDFKLAEGKLFIRIMQVHPLYIKEMHAQRDINLLAKSSLEYYLKLDKNSFLEKRRQRFDDGSNQDCYVFKYTALNINLIKSVSKPGEFLSDEQKAYRTLAKYREMGLDENGMELSPTEKAKPPPQELQAEISFDNPPANFETI
jgi:energy-coupling factor transporter ATP-binding protein EcfA2